MMTLTWYQLTWYFVDALIRQNIKGLTSHDTNRIIAIAISLLVVVPILLLCVRTGGRGCDG